MPRRRAIRPKPRRNQPLSSGRPTKQAVGREKRALAVLGEAIEKWEEAPVALHEGGACRDSGRHEAFFDRGVIRYGAGGIGPAACPPAGVYSSTVAIDLDLLFHGSESPRGYLCQGQSNGGQ